MPVSEPWIVPRDPATVLESEVDRWEDPELPWCAYIDDLLPRSSLNARYAKEGSTVFSSDYVELVRDCIDEGTSQVNARTGVGIRSLVHKSLSHECLYGLPLTGIRNIYPHIAAAEFAWTLMGTEDASWIQRHTSIWDKFTRDGKVPDAYGYRRRKAFGRDQLAGAIDTLTKDPTSRQVYVSAWDPACDGLNADNPGLPPCPVGFSLQVVKPFLHCTVHMRSSDIAVGPGYDTALYALLVDAIATDLKLARGLPTIQLDHAHIYEKHVPEMTRLFPPVIARPMPFPRWGVAAIDQDPDGYVAAVKAIAADWPQPKPHSLDVVAAPDKT